ncbi:MAG: preprotein translocase subunit SecG [Sphingomonadales bacterium]|jgi:preprotein translocase subunit SecG
MREILLVIHLFVSIGLVVVILLQRSEGGALGIGGSGGVMSARGAGNLLTRLTTYLAIAFMGLAIAQAILVGTTRGTSTLLEDVTTEEEAVDPVQDLGDLPPLPKEDTSDVPQPN